MCLLCVWGGGGGCLCGTVGTCLCSLTAAISGLRPVAVFKLINNKQ